MIGKFLGVAMILCLGVAAIAAIVFEREAVLDEHNSPPKAITVVAAGTNTASAKPLPAPAPEATEKQVDATAMAPYRAIVSRALGLDGAAAYRDIVVANAQQQIVCGNVRPRADQAFRAFVFVGTAGISALDDGSAEFKGMQAGACNVRP